MCKAILARIAGFTGSVFRGWLFGLVCLSALAQSSPEGGGGPAHFLPSDSSVAVIATGGNRGALVPVSFRAGKGMLFSHQWVEVQTSDGPVTLGFGSALLPFIDRGQVTIQYADGRVEHEYPLHVLKFYLDFGRAPGVGKAIEKVYVPAARADQIVEQQRHRRFIFPYIPLFHDCRTYVCAMQATIAGKSKLPCYLLFKGYW
jgi:hypothetical protein